jgi:hypothetical protein
MKVRDPHGIKAFGLVVYQVFIGWHFAGSFVDRASAEKLRSKLVADNELDDDECHISARYI